METTSYLVDESHRVNETNNGMMFSFHAGGVTVSFCDGSVHFLRQSISAGVLAELMTRNGGGVVEDKSWQ